MRSHGDTAGPHRNKRRDMVPDNMERKFESENATPNIIERQYGLLGKEVGHIVSGFGTGEYIDNLQIMTIASGLGQSLFLGLKKRRRKSWLNLILVR